MCFQQLKRNSRKLHAAQAKLSNDASNVIDAPSSRSRSVVSLRHITPSTWDHLPKTTQDHK